MFYDWKEAFINHGLDGLKHKGKSNREKQLEEELEQAQRALGEATLVIEIKKKRANTTAEEAQKNSRRRQRSLFYSISMPGIRCI